MTHLQAAQIIVCELEGGLPPRNTEEIREAFEMAIDIGNAFSYVEAYRWAQLIIFTETVGRKGKKKK